MASMPPATVNCGSTSLIHLAVTALTLTLTLLSLTLTLTLTPPLHKSAECTKLLVLNCADVADSVTAQTVLV